MIHYRPDILVIHCVNIDMISMCILRLVPQLLVLFVLPK